MFEENILTFNPGWDSNANKLDNFTDVRELQCQLKKQGVKLTTEADETTQGPRVLPRLTLMATKSLLINKSRRSGGGLDMMLFARNKVENVDQWKRVFDAQAEAGSAAGLSMVYVWRSMAISIFWKR